MTVFYSQSVTRSQEELDELVFRALKQNQALRIVASPYLSVLRDYDRMPVWAVRWYDQEKKKYYCHPLGNYFQISREDAEAAALKQAQSTGGQIPPDTKIDTIASRTAMHLLTGMLCYAERAVRRTHAITAWVGDTEYTLNAIPGTPEYVIKFQRQEFEGFFELVAGGQTLLSTAALSARVQLHFGMTLKQLRFRTETSLAQLQKQLTPILFFAKIKKPYLKAWYRRDEVDRLFR